MIPLRYNVRNLFVRWKTTLLTAVGFTLIVALLIVMLAFVKGLDAMAESTGRPGNVIILRDGANDELFSDIAMDDKVSELWLNHPEIEKAGEQSMVSREVYSIVTQEIPPKPGERASYRFLQVRGVEEPEMSGLVHNLGLKEGRWFDPNGNEVVMGEGIARTMGLKVGDVFEPRPPLKWTVVGIMDSASSAFNSEIWAKLQEVGAYFGKDSKDRRFYTSIVVTTKDLPTAEKFVKELQERTQVKVSPMTERKYYEEMTKSNATFLVAAIFIAVIMAVGGMFGLMNTMFAAVSQRIKDIGVLRIIGYRRWQILLSFLLESLFLALLGGALGVLLGFTVHGVEQTGFMSSGAGGGKTTVFRMKVDQSVLTAAMVFTLFMGVIGGIIPAWSAMRVKALDSLR